MKIEKAQKTQRTYLYDLALRLIILLLLGINSLAFFYFIFTPLTTYISYFILNIFYNISLQENLFITQKVSIEIISACVAASAYYLLAVLNLTTKSISWNVRIKAFVFGAVSLLFLNILRIVILASILFSIGFDTFSQFHIAFWIMGSTIFVAGIWIASVKLFRIKEIPIYSDLKEVLSLFKTKKRQH